MRVVSSGCCINTTTKADDMHTSIKVTAPCRRHTALPHTAFHFLAFPLPFVSPPGAALQVITIHQHLASTNIQARHQTHLLAPTDKVM